MKLLVFSFSLILTFCSGQYVQYSSVEKLIKIKCTVYSDTLNTFENIYFLNRNEKQIEKLPFYFNLEEQKIIIDAINEYRFFELPDTILRFNSKTDESGILRVEFDFYPIYCDIEFLGRKKQIYMSNTYNIETEESLRFDKIISVVYGIIEKREELKKYHKGI